MAEQVLSPISGTIQEVLVELGAKVAVDDELFIIEAMKMQNVVYSQVSGTIKDLRVKKGDKVEGEAVLAVVE